MRFYTDSALVSAVAEVLFHTMYLFVFTGLKML
jgi:hypothetical protein